MSQLPAGLVQLKASPAAAPVVPSRSALQPLGIHDIQITDGYWAERQRLNRAVSIPHAIAWEEKLGWIGNFALAAAGVGQSERTGREFSDSDVYKLLEAMAWEAGRTGDAALEEQLSRTVAVISAAQSSDGYLNTHFGQAGQPGRYTDLEWGHELYCYGHLFQAAVARLRCGVQDELVRVALKAADHVCAVFGTDELATICGHPEVEVALAELARATGRPEYLEQARLFLERRGHGILKTIEWGQEYFQDDIPIRAASVFRGHAVRAGYLAAGAIDVAVETGDTGLLDVVQQQYDRTLARRTYITGGMGSRHLGESFGEDFELPPDRGYCETCAAVASVMVAWRLLLATGEERYADVIERTLYNAIACSPSAEGDAFFYANPLHQRRESRAADPDHPCPRAESGARAPWFTVSCCPPNIARTYAQLASYIATVDGDRIRIHQFASGEITARLASGAVVRLSVRTDYPHDGRVSVTVVECDPAQEWSVALRIPAWAKVKLEGMVRQRELAVISGRLSPGDQFAMEIDMTPRLIFPDTRIDAVRGCLAVERGPLVLCLESPDMPLSLSADDFALDPTVPPISDGDGAIVSGRLNGHVDQPWPYSEVPVSKPRDRASVKLIPYATWGNRGPSTMRVWLPAAKPAR
ncbi:MAG: glycoside hydrolase family 127 protein [Propionibacteriaceae bacterium]|jgi:DUF1680 family protein|nr:glycoside hydrolase family 127 protein [Propionibacteriaceae bacterium]